MKRSMKSAVPALLLLALVCLSQGAHVADSIQCSSWGPSQCNRPGVPDKCPGMCSGSGSSGSGGVGPGIVIINDGRAIATGGTGTDGAGDVSYALCDNPSSDRALLLVPSQCLVPPKASNDRIVGMAGPRVNVEPRLVRPAWSQERGQPARGLPSAASAPRLSQGQLSNKGKGKAAKAKPAPQPGRWLDRDCNAALNMQRIGESRWRPLELCFWPDQGALPAKGKEYPGLGYKRLRDKPPKAQEQQEQPAAAQ
ncbi:hypothetical protein QJQ45_010470 [Haematococcus lacustris]|nr:hypothetical protein QJQ45_010470 [Haematococcus lacustris]